MSAFAEYVRDIRKNLEKGDATEHTHRPALKDILEACGEDIEATNVGKGDVVENVHFSI